MNTDANTDTNTDTDRKTDEISEKNEINAPPSHPSQLPVAPLSQFHCL